MSIRAESAESDALRPAIASLPELAMAEALRSPHKPANARKL